MGSPGANASLTRLFASNSFSSGFNDLNMVTIQA
jgi:hypothetical protein